MNGCFAIWRYRNEINGMKWFIELSVPNGSEWGRHVTALIEFHQISSFLRVNDWNWLKLMNRCKPNGAIHFTNSLLHSLNGMKRELKWRRNAKGAVKSIHLHSVTSMNGINEWLTQRMYMERQQFTQFNLNFIEVNALAAVIITVS